MQSTMHIFLELITSILSSTVYIYNIANCYILEIVASFIKFCWNFIYYQFLYLQFANQWLSENKDGKSDIAKLQSRSRILIGGYNYTWYLCFDIFLFITFVWRTVDILLFLEKCVCEITFYQCFVWNAFTRRRILWLLSVCHFVYLSPWF